MLWYPALPPAPGPNLVPNGQLECGLAGWGGLGAGPADLAWAGNVFRAEAVWDPHGGPGGAACAWIDPRSSEFAYDYYHPEQSALSHLALASLGWIHVDPGQDLTLAASVRTTGPAGRVELAVHEPGGVVEREEVAAGPDWQRVRFTAQPHGGNVFVSIGSSSRLAVAAVQLERGPRATPCGAREPVEAFLDTDHEGNRFTDPPAGLTLVIRTANHSANPATIVGDLVVTDFYDREVARLAVRVRLAPHATETKRIAGLARGLAGFFRVRWAPAGNELRCSDFPPLPGDAPRLFGCNHAYPWDFLNRLASAAGIGAWRDWSAQWQVVEPERGRFDFLVPDRLIDRERALGAVDVLLPFPSAAWSSSAKPERYGGYLRQAPDPLHYLAERLPLSFPPRDLADFGAYAARAAARYGRPNTAIQILNESVFTTYSLPSRLGFGLADYLRCLAVASTAIRAAAPQVTIVGGISTNVDRPLTRDFVAQGGLRWVDVFDLHVYEQRSAEAFERPLAELAATMRARGEARPIWITEWGCYGDDTPCSDPLTGYDALMEHEGRWPSERAAAEHLVKFGAVALAQGVRRIFLHPGPCGEVNGPASGSVLFAYGGEPRKILPCLAEFTRRVGVPESCAARVTRGGVHGCVFPRAGRFVAVAWAETGRERPLARVRDIAAWDVMGNRMQAAAVTLGAAPVYLEADSADQLQSALGMGAP